MSFRSPDEQDQATQKILKSIASRPKSAEELSSSTDLTPQQVDTIVKQLAAVNICNRYTDRKDGILKYALAQNPNTTHYGHHQGFQQAPYPPYPPLQPGQYAAFNAHHQGHMPFVSPPAYALPLSRTWSGPQVMYPGTMNSSIYGVPAGGSRVNLGEYEASEKGMTGQTSSPERRSKVQDGKKEPCAFFLKTGTCAWGETCKFAHPIDEAPQACFNSLGLPLRPDQQECSFYLKNYRCAFGFTCRYHHPEPPDSVITSVLGPSRGAGRAQIISPRLVAPPRAKKKLTTKQETNDVIHADAPSTRPLETQE